MAPSGAPTGAPSSPGELPTIELKFDGDIDTILDNDIDEATGGILDILNDFDDADGGGGGDTGDGSSFVGGGGVSDPDAGNTENDSGEFNEDNTDISFQPGRVSGSSQVLVAFLEGSGVGMARVHRIAAAIAKNFTAAEVPVLGIPARVSSRAANPNPFGGFHLCNPHAPWSRTMWINMLASIYQACPCPLINPIASSRLVVLVSPAAACQSAGPTVILSSPRYMTACTSLMDTIGTAAAACGDNPATFRGSCAEMGASRATEDTPPGWVAPSARVVQAQPAECRETTQSLKNLVARFSDGYRSKWSCNGNVSTC